MRIRTLNRHRRKPMLTLKNIKKDYETGDTVVHALQGITVDFRDNEFVSVLGASGCGKTTLLNIVGGLDRYTDGDLIINGVSTKTYRDADWDTYRNHTVGFVFQTYNLIMHQTVLGNVELALTLSGVPSKERRELAKEALIKVGLKEQMNKKPNQLSGGQMQRVAIARAIVNNPDIILADEPTGALDTQTSVQVMDILKEIAEDRLVIMVTHNPNLAAEYSTRIVQLSDGKIIDDSHPVSDEERAKAMRLAKENAEAELKEAPSNPGFNQGAESAEKIKKPPKSRKKRPSMSFATALSLSFKNLLTKKARTVLVSFAGSIGIIGIALILSLSDGFQAYINRVQEDTLSTYPLTIEAKTVDMTAMASSILGVVQGEKKEKEPGMIYSNDIASKILMSVMKQQVTNNLAAFKEKFMEDKEIQKYVTSVQFTYDMALKIYFEGDQPMNSTGSTLQVNPSSIIRRMFGSYAGISAMGMSTSAFTELIDNPALLSSQYDLVGEGSRWPKSYDEVVLSVSSNGEINDYILYALGILDPAEFYEMIEKVSNGEEVEFVEHKFSYSDLLGMRFKHLPDAEWYNFDNITGIANQKTAQELADSLKNEALELKIVGIVQPKANAVATSISGTIGYQKSLVDYTIERTRNNPAVKAQLQNPERDVFTGIDFNVENSGITDINAKKSYEENLKKLGYVDPEIPESINIYVADFAAKDKITEWIKSYNAAAEEGDKISYTDYVGLMMSSVSIIINAISYVLIGFVAISLVVSSIMIGVITYISVLERTKEIGILRSIGASKRDISRVFNAETFIVGLVAGALGVLVAILIDIPINIILSVLAGLNGIAAVPWWGAIALIVISVILTLIAGIIPSSVASKRDPVVALRTE